MWWCVSTRPEKELHNGGESSLSSGNMFVQNHEPSIQRILCMRSQLVISADSLRQPAHRTRATQEALFFLVFCFPPAILHTQQRNATTSTDGQPANIGEQNPLHSSQGSYPGPDVTKQSSLTCPLHVLFCARFPMTWSECKKNTQPVSRKSGWFHR